MHAQPAGFMLTKLSLTSAYPKLGHSHTKNNDCMYKTIELSQQILNIYALGRARSFSRHAVDMHSLSECCDLYVVDHPEFCQCLQTDDYFEKCLYEKYDCIIKLPS